MVFTFSIVISTRLLVGMIGGEVNMPLYEFEGRRPQIAATSFVHPQAVIIGDVSIGEKCFIGAGAVLRGDYGTIIISNGSNVQENCVIHAQPATTALIKENVDIGHGCILHGPCIIHEGVIIGMGSIIGTGCELETGSFLGAGSLLPQNQTIPAKKLALGNPARVVKDVSEQQTLYAKIAIEIYQGLPERYQQSLVLIED